jgi:CubicO group peptidase (beta-lactamase class C family)
MKLTLILFILISLQALAGPLKTINSLQDFESYLNECHFNGVLLVNQDQKLLFKKAFGFKNLSTKSPLNTNDKFQIGSVTKQFVAAALLKLQQENKLSLDDDIVKYLPNYPTLAGLKIRHILNHTAGIANYTDQASFWQLTTDDKSLSLDDIIKYTALLPFDFKQGTDWKYSNSDYIIAGKIVEVVSGLQWNEYIKTYFLKPLKMNDTGYSEHFDKVSDVIGHIDEQQVDLFNLSWALSAGALYSNADDLLKWTAIYDESNILSQDSKLQMQTPFLRNYALGVLVDTYNDETRITHGGRTPGFKTTLTYLKKSKVTLIKLDNTDGGLVDMAGVALDFFTRGTAQVLKVDNYILNPKKLNEYIGTYRTQNLSFEVFVKEGSLYLQPNDGQPAYLLTANDIDSFRLLSFAGEEFIRDPKTKAITDLKHYQDGHVSVFSKLTTTAP